MQEKPVLAHIEEAVSEVSHSGMSFDTNKPLKELKKFQEPTRFNKAQFNLKLYKHE
jgi:hypothetical protein